MKDHDANRHPGPWRVMNVDSETAGILVAVGFLAMGLVSIPVARWFVLGCLALGAVFAILLRFTPRKFRRLAVGTLIILAAFFGLWPALSRAGHIVRRPHTVSSNAVYVLPHSELFEAGYWLECWFDQRENDDQCKLTDENGNIVFKDVYVTCGSQATVPQSELVIMPETGRRWIQSHDVMVVNVPVLYVRYGQILFPRGLYAEAKQEGYCYGS